MATDSHIGGFNHVGRGLTGSALTTSSLVAASGDSSDADLVLEGRYVLIMESPRKGQHRRLAFAYVIEALCVLAVAIVPGERQRIVSFRPARRNARKAYHAWLESDREDKWADARRAAPRRELHGLGARAPRDQQGTRSRKDESPDWRNRRPQARPAGCRRTQDCDLAADNQQRPCPLEGDRDWLANAHGEGAGQGAATQNPLARRSRSNATHQKSHLIARERCDQPTRVDRVLIALIYAHKTSTPADVAVLRNASSNVASGMRRRRANSR